MKTPAFILTFLVPIALFLTPGCASTGTIYDAEVKKEYDSVEGVTYWSHTPILVKNYGLGSNRAVNMQAVAVCEGEAVTPCDSPEWGLFFQVEGSQLTDNTGLTIRLDDRRIRPGTENYNAGTGTLSAFSEQFAYRLSREDIRDLAQLPGGEVEGRISGTDLDLSYERRKAVRLLYQRFDSGEKESTS